MEGERRTSRWIIVVGLVLIRLLTGEVILLILENSELRARLKGSSNANSAQLIQPGDIITPFSYQLPSADSGIYTFDSWAPNTLVFLFSTSCPFCEDNIPKWAMLYGARARNDINILGISVDPSVTTAGYIRTHEFSYNVISTFIDTSFQARNHLNGVPITFLVDSIGMVEQVWTGVLTENQFTEILTVLSDTDALGAASTKN